MRNDDALIWDLDDTSWPERYVVAINGGKVLRTMTMEGLVTAVHDAAYYDESDYLPVKIWYWPKTDNQDDLVVKAARLVVTQGHWEHGERVTSRVVTVQLVNVKSGGKILDQGTFIENDH